MEADWYLHYFRWVIEDGEPELHVGDVFDWFSVSFWADAVLSPSADRVKRCFELDRTHFSYRVNAEVLYISSDPAQGTCVLDFGLQACSQLGALIGVPLPEGCRVGDFVTGDIRLEIPLCTAMQPLHLGHRWRVHGVLAGVTSFGAYPGDGSLPQYAQVDSTDALRAPYYILRCSNAAGESASPGLSEESTPASSANTQILAAPE